MLKVREKWIVGRCWDPSVSGKRKWAGWGTTEN